MCLVKSLHVFDLYCSLDGQSFRYFILPFNEVGQSWSSERVKTSVSQLITGIFGSQFFSWSISGFSVPLHHQTTGKMVKRWTVGLSHFPCCAEGPLCETEGIPGKNFGYEKDNRHDLS